MIQEGFEFADLNRLGNVLKNSKQMMDNSKMPVQNKQVQESIKKTNTSIAGDDMYESDEKPMPNLTEQYYNRMSGGSNRGGSNDVFDFNDEELVNSKLPKAVQDIMRESKKLRSSMRTTELSDDLVNKITGGSLQKINEETTPQVTKNAGNIDYSLIKTIVEDCMKKYTATIKKSLLNEGKGGSSLELMTQEGNTFKFVTTDGKVFEGKLTYKGKIK